MTTPTGQELFILLLGKESPHEQLQLSNGNYRLLEDSGAQNHSPAAVISKEARSQQLAKEANKGEEIGKNPVVQEPERKLQSQAKQDIKDGEQNPRDRNDIRFTTNLKPVFLNEHQRKFANPIYYLGGPRLPARNRWSVDSVLSLD